MSSKNPTSIRLFRSDLLEALTHVHPLVPLLVWTPVISWLLWRAVTIHGLSITDLIPVAAAALLVWTLTEYGLHRFVFHFPAKSRLGKWLVFLFHGVHHESPQDKTRLVMPPAGAILIMAMIWPLFQLLIPAPWAEPFCAFFLIGYLVYDYIHYATHHFPMRLELFQQIKRHHMKHHYSGQTGRYGVSSPLWYIVFRTTGR